MLQQKWSFSSLKIEMKCFVTWKKLLLFCSEIIQQELISQSFVPLKTQLLVEISTSQKY